ncbi:MAG: hypothetical protein Q7R73_03345 [bacterium]|nr:hypothetical protein [bacterium]
MRRIVENTSFEKLLLEEEKKKRWDSIRKQRGLARVEKFSGRETVERKKMTFRLLSCYLRLAFPVLFRNRSSGEVISYLNTLSQSAFDDLLKRARARLKLLFGAGAVSLGGVLVLLLL